MTEAWDAIVIGSGFGGAIAACRLAEAGQRVLVLERGRSYAALDFPRDPAAGRELLWRYPHRRAWRGLYDLRALSGIGTLTAAGVGGGSLVFANVLIRPDARVFDERWPRGVDATTLAPAYDRVAAMQLPRSLPATMAVRKDAAMGDAVRAMGRSDLVSAPEAVDWEPDDAGHGCRLVAECELGCRFGAKRSVDRTYLAAATRAGAEVRPDTLAWAIEPTAAGYRVSTVATRTGERRQLGARRVVLAAGTLGTAELLLRARDRHRTLPRLSPRLGLGFSGNGDFIGTVVGTRDDLEPWHGPDVTSILRAFDAEPGITIATPTFAEPLMRALVGPALNGGIALPGPVGELAWRVAGRVLPHLVDDGPVGRAARDLVARGAATADEAAHATLVFAIGRDSADGRLVLRGRGARTRLDVQWDYAARNAALVTRMTGLLDGLAAGYGGRFVPSPTWAAARRIVTVHPLGGCALGETTASGVVGPGGEVHGYPGLYVADGSVIPGSIGFHPAMTIAAVAESIAASIVAAL